MYIYIQLGNYIDYLYTWITSAFQLLKVKQVAFYWDLTAGDSHGVRAFWILGVQFGSCGYIRILLASK